MLGTNEYETVAADVFIISNKEEADSGFLRSVPGIAFGEDETVKIDAKRMTGYEGIFA